MRILMILTGESPKRPSRSLSLDQIIEAYYLLQRSGNEVVIASSQEEHSPFRNGRNRSTQDASSTQRFQSDRRARDAISDPLKIEQIYPEDFDGMICIGALEAAAHTDDAELVLSLLEALLAAGKPVAVVPGEIEIPPYKPLDCLLITGDKVRTPVLAAKAILVALSQPGT